MDKYVIIPQFLVTKELVQLASECIDSWRQHDVFIISVDDSGEYQKAEGADEAMSKSDLVLHLEKNSGFAKACNTGFKAILNDNTIENAYIICSNNDILVYNNTIKGLTEPFELFDNVAISGIISTKEKEVEGKTLDKVSWNQISQDGLLQDRMQDGGLWCSTKQVLQKIGIFDEIFLRGGYEDVDLFLRARDTFKMRIVMNGKAWYWHKQGATRWNTEKIGAVNNFGLQSKSIEQENLQRFIKKWGYNPHTRQIWKETLIFNY